MHWDALQRTSTHCNTLQHTATHEACVEISDDTAHSVEDETPNARRNPNRNPEWWGDFSQLVEIEKLRFLRISRYKFKLRF